MNRELKRWLVSNEQVGYTEEEIEQLVDKPLDPQVGYNEHNDGLNAEHRINTLISTTDLPKNPKQGDSYQVRDALWVWNNGRWVNRYGAMGR